MKDEGCLLFDFENEMIRIYCIFVLYNEKLYKSVLCLLIYGFTFRKYIFIHLYMYIYKISVIPKQYIGMY